MSKKPQNETTGSVSGANDLTTTVSKNPAEIESKTRPSTSKHLKKLPPTLQDFLIEPKKELARLENSINTVNERNSNIETNNLMNEIMRRLENKAMQKELTDDDIDRI